MFSVAVELSCRRDAIILSLPCSSFELIPLIIATTQEHWGSDQVILKDNTWWRIRAYVFCHAGVLACLFIVMVGIFDMMSLKIGYQILNYIIISWSFIFGFYLSLGIPQVLFKVIFCCSYCFACSLLFGIRLGRLLFLSVFVCWSGITAFATGGQVSDDTINLINY